MDSNISIPLAYKSRCREMEFLTNNVQEFVEEFEIEIFC